MSVADSAPDRFAVAFHRVLLDQQDRAGLVERTYGWCVILACLCVAVYRIVRRTTALPARQLVVPALLAITIVQLAMLPPLYGTLLLTGEPPCVTVVHPAATIRAARGVHRDGVGDH